MKQRGPKHRQMVLEPGRRYCFPNFFIIGGMKCGTSSLARNLHKHPQVFLANEGGEVHYICTPDNFGKGPDWYLAHFPEQPGIRAYGDKTPAYIDLRNHMRLKALAQNGRLITIFRDPVTRFQSQYNYIQRPKVRADIREAHARPFRIEYLQEPWFDRRIFERGIYDVQVESLLRHFPRKQIHFCFLEDFRGHEQREYDRIYAFLGIDSIPVKPRRVNEQTSYAFPLDNEARQALYQAYKPHNDRLFEMLGIAPRKVWDRHA
jgi:hypothetical protein